MGTIPGFPRNITTDVKSITNRTQHPTKNLNILRPRNKLRPNGSFQSTLMLYPVDNDTKKLIRLEHICNNFILQIDLVQLHGGNVSVTSEPGKGSVFSFTI